VKKFLFCLFAFSSIQLISAQDNAVEKDSLHLNYGIEKPPEFPGGINSFRQFIAENFRPPSGVEGNIIVNFVIEKDGSVTDIKVVKHLGRGTKREAIRVISKSPKWIPGEQKGRKVRVQYSVPIQIKMQL